MHSLSVSRYVYNICARFLGMRAVHKIAINMREVYDDNY